MTASFSSNQHKAFTLIELMIVILIISLMGFFVFSEVKKQEEKKEVIDPTGLVSSLRKTFANNSEFEFLCIHKSTECYVAQGAELISYAGTIKLGRDLEFYSMDDNDHLVQIEEFGRIKDEKVTLRMQFYANGSNTQAILANDEGVYFIPAYFGESKKVESLDEAQELWIKEDFDLGDSGRYY
ncbi:MAG: prepilin-type N-terminal cleavage/methylation domain-containing protein [Campylobacterales bacterium]|nr:prepilin-type N-terminal cleavage/methylation domain-containing protein [Campylobacterales bacterium]